jgi:polyhydroxyalkanoate synthesis regulator phasin
MDAVGRIPFTAATVDQHSYHRPGALADAGARAMLPGGMTPANSGSEAADALLAAIDKTVRATLGQAQLAGDRAQDLVDDASSAADRVRERLDSLRPARADEVKALQSQLAALETRVARLEQAIALQARAPGSVSAAGGEDTATDD